MDAELKAKWVAELRGGKYQQANRTLREDPYCNYPERFCCLGVLANVLGARWEGSTPFIGETHISHDEGGWLNERFSGGLTFEEQRNLSRMNDNGADFAHIADFIEYNL